jgi:hypothetical protein
MRSTIRHWFFPLHFISFSYRQQSASPALDASPSRAATPTRSLPIELTENFLLTELIVLNQREHITVPHYSQKYKYCFFKYFTLRSQSQLNAYRSIYFSHIYSLQTDFRLRLTVPRKDRSGNEKNVWAIFLVFERLKYKKYLDRDRSFLGKDLGALLTLVYAYT